jgi:hypothetical protein
MTDMRIGPLIVWVLVIASPAFAHSGPPFPIVLTETRGPYSISIWTDPDSSDNGIAAGQFWIIIEPPTTRASIPEGTRATVTVRPLDSTPPAGPRASEPAMHATTEPVRGDVTNQFAMVTLDHEGPFAVHVDVDGPLGRAVVDSRIDATYDLRPAPYMIAWYLVPFVLAGVLWTRLLLRRRSAQRSTPAAQPSTPAAQRRSGRVQQL